MFGLTKPVKKTVVLTSSNGSRKYVTDAFEIVSLPTGWVAHFRYELKLVEESLAGALPDTRGATNNPVRGLRVMTAYVFQTRNVKDPRTFDPIAVHPMRYARIVDAYKTGVGDRDVAHFYFKLEEYWVPGAATSPEIDQVMAMLASRRYAGQIAPVTASGREGETAAFAVISAIPDAHLTHQPTADATDVRQYYPWLLYIRGIQKHKGWWRRNPTPQFDDGAQSSTYKLTERHEYLLNFSFHVPASIGSNFGEPQAGSTIQLTYDKSAFASEADRSLGVESRYDEQLWLVIPATTDRSAQRELLLSTALKVASPDRVDPIDLSFTIPVAIGQNILRRLVFIGFGILGDVSFAIATIIVALAKSAPVVPGQALGPFSIPLDTWNVAVTLYAISAVAKVVAGFGKS
jgi:hypothetical protein